MEPEIKIVINPQTGAVKKIQLIADDAQSQEKGFRAYQALSEEIRQFGKTARKIVSLERAIGRL